MLNNQGNSKIRLVAKQKKINIEVGSVCPIILTKTLIKAVENADTVP